MVDKKAEKWMDIGEWKQGRIRSGAQSLIWISLLFGVAFTGLSAPAVLAIPDELAKENYMILVVLLFPLVGISALGLFVYSLMAWRKYGVTELILDPAPGSIGGDFGGRIETRIPYHADNKVNITLNCQRLRTTGSGKNRSTKTTTKWQREGLATINRSADGGTEIAFRFDIPENLPQSERASSNYHRWVLQLDCELPGIDFNRSFTVPVFETGKPLYSSLDIPYVKDSAPLQQAPAGKVQISQTADGMQFYYPWYRHLWPSIMLASIGTLFAVIGYFVGKESGDIIFPLAFGGIGSIVAIAGYYMMGNTLTTTVSPRGIHIIRNVFGLRFQRKARHDEITKLERNIGSQMQSGTKHTVYYTIKAHTKDGRKLTIADSLEGSRLADFIERKIRDALWPGGKKPEETELVID